MVGNFPRKCFVFSSILLLRMVSEKQGYYAANPCLENVKRFNFEAFPAARTPSLKSRIILPST